MPCGGCSDNFLSRPAEAKHKGGAPPLDLSEKLHLWEMICLLREVPERVVTPLSYSLMDLANPVVAAQDSSPVPAGDVHMGGRPPPDLVKNTSPANAPVVRGFSECASIPPSHSRVVTPWTQYDV